MDDREISNNELVAALVSALRRENALVASVIEMLIEVEKRQLHLQRACPSTYVFCTRRLGMSEGAAFRRTTAARIAAKFPMVLDALREGRVHLSNVVALRDVITNDNVNELLREIAGKTRREVEAIVARLAPRPDVRASIRKLPERATPSATETVISNAQTFTPTPASASTPTPTPTPPPPPARSIPVRAQLTALAEARHKVQFTASTELREKLERAQSLMRHRNIGGDLAVVVERAIDLLIGKLEKEKLAATSRPRSAANAKSASNSKKGIPAAVRREVVARDGGQCAFVSEAGERCPARDLLELDHARPRARGGPHDESNLRLYCHAHNQYAAELVFGREHMARAIELRRRNARTRADASEDQMPLRAPPTTKGSKPRA